MARVFNLGVGMVMVVAADRADDALGAVTATGVDASVVGRVHEGRRGVELVGPDLWPGPVDGTGSRR